MKFSIRQLPFTVLLLYLLAACQGQINPPPPAVAVPKPRLDTLSLVDLKKYILANRRLALPPLPYTDKDKQKFFLSAQYSNFIIVQKEGVEDQRDLFALEFYDDKGALLSALNLDSLNPYLNNAAYKPIEKGYIDWEMDQDIDTLPLPKATGRMHAYAYRTNKLILELSNESSKIGIQFRLIGFSKKGAIIGWEQSSYFFNAEGNYLTSICNNLGLTSPMWDNDNNLLFLNYGGDSADGSPYFLPESIAVYDLIKCRMVYSYSAVSGTAVSGFSHLMINEHSVYIGAEEDYSNPRRMRYFVFYPDERTVKCYNVIEDNKVNSQFYVKLKSNQLRDFNPTYTQTF
ncbi:MAG: hypothetical protein J0L99_14545 [Chitinophagales bacterium]|nr:hypothetical protein [Chitinophagales bacterium]